MRALQRLGGGESGIRTHGRVSTIPRSRRRASVADENALLLSDCPDRALSEPVSFFDGASPSIVQRSEIRNSRECYLCLQNNLSPMCPEWTSRKWRARQDSNLGPSASKPPRPAGRLSRRAARRLSPPSSRAAAAPRSSACASPTPRMSSRPPAQRCLDRRAR